MHYEPISYFFEVIRWQSISKAAIELGISQPALSRYLKIIEEKTNTKLYTYHNKKIILTPQGQALANFLKERKDLEQSFLNTIHEKEHGLQGKLTLITSPGIANSWLIPCIAPYINNNPSVRVTVVTTDEEIVLDSLYDMAISVKIIQSGVENIFLKRSKIKLFASKNYLKEFGTPLKLSDLAQHRLIMLPKHIQNESLDALWLFMRHYNNISYLPPFLEVTTVAALKQAAENNIGIIALCTEFINSPTSNLVEILSDQLSANVDFYVSYLKKRKDQQPLKSLRLFFKSLKKQ